MPSIINSDNGAVSGSAGLKFDSADDGILHIQNNGNTSVVVSESGMRVPIGTTAERPASPQNGTIRYNTDTLELEAYANGVWRSVAGVEPALKLDFDQYQFDGRISFTRATNGTYFDRNGVLRTAGSGVARFDHRLENGSWVNKGLLIEEARTNLVQRSEEFNDAYWILQNNSGSASKGASNTITSPDGTVTADALNTGSGAYDGVASSNITIANDSATYTISYYVKAGSVTLVRVRLRLAGGTVTDGSVFFNLSTGVVSAQDSGRTGTIMSVGDGWYRVTVTGSNNSTGNTFGQTFILSNLQSGNFYVWGAQFEAGAFPTSYIKTTTASATRNADVASMTSTNFSSWYNASEGTVYSLVDGQSPVDANNFETLFHWAISNNSNNERIQLVNSVATGVPRINFSVTDNNVNQASLTRVISPWSTTKQYAGASAYKVDDFALSVDGATVLTGTNGTLPTVDRLYLGSNSAGSSFFLNGHIAKFYYWPNRLPNAKLQSLTS